MRRLAYALCVLSVACGGDEVFDDGTGAKKPRTCLPGDGVTGFPQTVEEAVALINSFPKPVSLPCVLESLDRPIDLTATSNSVSAQPAFGPNNPRIFIFRGDLSLSVVTKGDGRELLEFGLARGEEHTLKAEIHFPVTEDIEPAVPYERVIYQSGTTCGFCHLDETRDPTIDFTAAFQSQLIRPASNKLVDLDYLMWSYSACDPELEPDRCAMFDSIFAHGEVRETEY